MAQIGGEPTPELAAVAAEQYTRLPALLDDDLRAVAVAKMEQRSNQEIATMLDCSLSTVEAQSPVDSANLGNQRGDALRPSSPRAGAAGFRPPSWANQTAQSGGDALGGDCSRARRRANSAAAR